MPSRSGAKPANQCAFWRQLTDRLIAAGRKTIRLANLTLSKDAEDFAQLAVTAAMEFFRQQCPSMRITSDGLAELQDGVTAYAFAAMKNAIVSEVRTVRRQEELLRARVDGSDVEEGSTGLSRTRVDTPEELLLAKDYAQRVAASSQRSTMYQQIAAAVAQLVDDSPADPKPKTLAVLSGRSIKEVGDFRAMLQSKGLGPNDPTG